MSERVGKILFNNIERINVSMNDIDKYGLKKEQILPMMEGEQIQIFRDVTEVHSLFTGRGNRAQLITIKR